MELLHSVFVEMLFQGYTILTSYSEGRKLFSLQTQVKVGLYVQVTRLQSKKLSTSRKKKGQNLVKCECVMYNEFIVHTAHAK